MVQFDSEQLSIEIPVSNENSNIERVIPDASTTLRYDGKPIAFFSIGGETWVNIINLLDATTLKSPRVDRNLKYISPENYVLTNVDQVSGSKGVYLTNLDGVIELLSNLPNGKGEALGQWLGFEGLPKVDELFCKQKFISSALADSFPTQISDKEVSNMNNDSDSNEVVTMKQSSNAFDVKSLMTLSAKIKKSLTKDDETSVRINNAIDTALIHQLAYLAGDDDVTHLLETSKLLWALLSELVD